HSRRGLCAVARGGRRRDLSARHGGRRCGVEPDGAPEPAARLCATRRGLKPPRECAAQSGNFHFSEPAMADKIEEIVNRAIEHTLTILGTSRGAWSVARKGL